MEPVERALDVALIVMRNGGSTVLADRTLKNVLKGFGKRDVSATWRIDFVAAHSAAEDGFSTVLRPVGGIGVNLARVSEASILARRVAQGEVDIAVIPSEIKRIEALAPPYNRWAVAAAAACAGAAFSQILGGDWGALGIAFVAAGLGRFVRALLQSRKLGGARVTLVCGVLSACVAGLGLRLGLSRTVPQTAIASIIYMLPGLPLINGFFDLIHDGHLLVGLERIADAAFVMLILAIAIAFANAVFM